MLTVDLLSVYLLSLVDIVIRYIKVYFTFGLPDYVRYIEEFVTSRFHCNKSPIHLHNYMVLLRSVHLHNIYMYLIATGLQITCTYIHVACTLVSKTPSDYENLTKQANKTIQKSSWVPKVNKGKKASYSKGL